MATWEISPTLSNYKSLANTTKRHLHFLPNDDYYNIHLKSLIASSRGETSEVKELQKKCLHWIMSWLMHWIMSWLVISLRALWLTSTPWPGSWGGSRRGRGWAPPCPGSVTSSRPRSSAWCTAAVHLPASWRGEWVGELDGGWVSKRVGTFRQLFGCWFSKRVFASW